MHSLIGMNASWVIELSLLSISMSLRLQGGGLDGNWKKIDSPIYDEQIYFAPSGTFDAIGWQKIQSAPAPNRYLHGTWELKGSRITLKVTDSALGSIFGPRTPPNGQPSEPEYSPWRINFVNRISGKVSKDRTTIRIADPFGFPGDGKSQTIQLQKADMKLMALDWNAIDLAKKRSKQM